MEKAELQELIAGCKKNQRQDQKMLYQAFYSHGYGIAIRYARNKNDASVILNKGFYKALFSLQEFDLDGCFKGWLRTLIIQAAAEHYFKSRKISVLTGRLTEENSVTLSPAGKLSYPHLVKILHDLADAYRFVFNMFAIDDYDHAAIAAMLSVSVKTSENLLISARTEISALITTKFGSSVA